MQHLHPLNSKEVKHRILKRLENQFGFKKKLNYYFFESNKDKVYIIGKDMQLVDLDKLRIDSIGMYFGTFAHEKLRLSIEGSQIIGPYATKNVLELNDEEFEKWLKGLDFELETELEGFVLVKHGEDFVGCGKVKNKELLNYVPKSRRLKVVNN